ncbi:MAG TPA: biotin/lipoyl-binding protein [Mycobacteriales bacterium]|nr:biotin/lipoyl-binding protein [Mycobacteriales bacterium]
MSDSNRRRRRRKLVVGGALVLVVAAGGTAWGLTNRAAAGYRTAIAGHATVVQSLAATGTVTPVSHADESFQVAGTVAKVKVRTGDKVHAGEVLAHLDRSQLRADLASARSTLASARNRLSSDATGQTSQASSSSRGSTPTLQASHPAPVSPSPASGGTSSGSGGLARLQAAVRSAQQATDSALTDAADALDAANAACGPSPSTGASTTAPAADSSPSPEPTSTDSASGGEDCSTAGAALLADEQTVDRAEQQLAAAEAALTKQLTAMLAAARNGSQSSGSGSSSPSQSAPSSGSTVSAADIALDQADIDRAQATVASDEATLAQATLRAAINGRVAAVTVARGDQVSASSSTVAITITGSRQEQSTIGLSATEIRRVKVGMTARVLVDGLAKPLSGRVVAINSAGVQSSSGTVTYPVTITLPSGTTAVSGAAAAVTVVVATVGNVLSVPTSAVHYDGSTSYVEVVRNGEPLRRTVKVGAIGPGLTQITSGVTDGEQVVLADLGAAVPSTSSSLTNRGGFGGGGATFVRRFSGSGGGSFPAPPAGASIG